MSKSGPKRSSGTSKVTGRPSRPAYQNGPILDQPAESHYRGHDAAKSFLLPEGASYYIVPCTPGHPAPPPQHQVGRCWSAFTDTADTARALGTS